MINEKLEKLYAEYCPDKMIIPCGVVDEETYLVSKPRIVFLLKEPHSRKAGWSIVGGLRRQVQRGLTGHPFERGYAYTWVQAGVWAYAILNAFKSYRELKKPLFRAKGIQAIGMTNLKKTGGGATSDREIIREHAKREVDLWRQELEIMEPDLVICGNTYHDVVGNLELTKVQLLNHNGTPYFYSLWNFGAHKTIILDFWHPARRGNRDETLKLLEQLIDKVQEKELFAKALFSHTLK